MYTADCHWRSAFLRLQVDYFSETLADKPRRVSPLSISYSPPARRMSTTPEDYLSARQEDLRKGMRAATASTMIDDRTQSLCLY